MRELTMSEMYQVSGTGGQNALPDACSKETLEMNVASGAIGGAIGGAAGGPFGALAGAIAGAALGAATAAIGCAIEFRSRRG